MNAVPLPKDWYTDMKHVVIGAPRDGHLDGDGSSPEEAFAIEAAFGEDNGWPVFVEHWLPSKEDLELLNNGGILRLWIFMPQMPVHAMDVVSQ